MSYIPVYSTRINWENEPSIVSPINATNLNKMDYALKAHDDTLANWDITKANESDLLLALKEVSYDTDTGVFVFTWFNGTTSTIDLNIEKIPVSFSMDANGVITMTTEDGTTYTADVGALIKTYTFTDSSVIDFNVTTDASGNKTVTADIVTGSIDGTKLTPNYLADCTQAKTGAETAATNSAASSQDAEAWAVGTRGGVPVPSTDPAYENNAEYWAHHTSSSLAGLSDTDINNPSDGEVLKYNGTTSKWENGQAAAGGGSTIEVSTSETPLYGQNITITDGVTTLTGAFDNTGHATFSGVTMTGNLTIACGTASTSLNVPYFGNYTAVVSSFSASITVTYPGGTCTCVGNGESYTASGSPYTFTVHGAATYTITVTIDGVSKTDTVVITTDGQTETSTIEFGTINVTYENDFRGVSITCTLGGTTITKTAPSAGNTMSFYPPTTGNWTISGTVGGVPYPTTANVTSLSTPVSVNLETIPDGSTATPTDDIQKWLACAGIKDKAYTTLTQVLGDSETFNALLGDSNACAYMKRSTSWAIATGQVPVMTSDTTPSGTVSYSSQMSGVGCDGYKAFDGDTSRGWLASSYFLSGDWLAYKFASAKRIVRATVGYIFTGSSTVYFKIQGSNDDFALDINDLCGEQSISGASAYKEIDVTFTTSDDYQSYRIIATRNIANQYGNGFNVQFYEADICDNQYAMNLLGQYDTACDALLSDSTWASAIANSTYFESVLNVKVPVMTSNTTPSGTASASSEYYGAYHAFSSASSNGWLATTQADSYVQYEFDTPIILSKVTYKQIMGGGGSSDYYTSETFDVKGSTDGTTFNPISTGITLNDVSVEHESVFGNDTPYRIIRVAITSFTPNANTKGGGLKLQFYGRKSSGEKIHGGNPTYDSFYRIVDGNHVPVTDPSLLDAGTYTIYSNGLAKDPANLSNDYGKTVRICPNTKEIVVRPDNSLYWLGSKRYDLEVLNSSNGWTCQTYRSFGGTVNEDDTSMTLVPSAATNLVAVGSNNVVNDDITVHAIGKWLITSGSSRPDAEYAAALTNKSFALSTAQIANEFANFTNAMSHVSAQFSNGGYIVAVHDPYNSNYLQLNIQALWYE